LSFFFIVVHIPGTKPPVSFRTQYIKSIPTPIIIYRPKKLGANLISGITYLQEKKTAHTNKNDPAIVFKNCGLTPL